MFSILMFLKNKTITKKLRIYILTRSFPMTKHKLLLIFLNNNIINNIIKYNNIINDNFDISENDVAILYRILHT